MAILSPNWKNALLWLLAQPCLSYVEMNWNTSYYFGPDGPWQAITLGIQNNRTTDIRTVNLIPADNLGYTYIPTKNLCDTEGANEYCGIGGTMDYPSSFTNATTWANKDDFYVSGITTSVMLNSGTQRASDVAVIPLTSASNTHIKYATGDVPGAEIGFFYKGSSTSSCPGTGCDFTRALYDSQQIQSLSYGMHIGAASLDYGGSLVLGGYDKSRIAGPIVTSIAGSVDAYGAVDPNSFRLQDIIIGTEAGASPFAFQDKTGLLHGSDSTASAQSLPVILYSSTAYIGLPEVAATALAAQLPVRRDDATGYYLWNDDDPSYTKIITSPAYLGFVFSGEGTSSITIKVPFLLLNLTLEPRASGLDQAVPYFPIRVRERNSYEFYNFGRAFLQAAFLGESFSKGLTWLAQASGPGGEESEVVDMDDQATTLDVPADFDIFNQSWAGYWTPLPLPQEERSGDEGLSGGAKAGIVVGVLAGIALVCAAGFIYYRRTRKVAKDRKPGSEPPPVELHGTSTRIEMASPQQYEVAMKHDSGRHPAARQEMPGWPAPT